MSKRVISYSLGNNILFDKIEHGENILLLFHKTGTHQKVLNNFIRQSASNNSLLYYISHKTNSQNLLTEGKVYSFNVLTEDVIHDIKKVLTGFFDKIEKTNQKLLLVSDWSNANFSKCDIFLPFLEDLINRSKGLNPPRWKKKYHTANYKMPLLLVNAFDVSSLSNDLIQKLISLHQRVYLLQPDMNTFFLPTISPSLETIFPKMHVLPQDALEKLAKDNLELIVFMLLEKDNKSGYQLLKEIAQHFGCILSQGTLYPLLYQLEKGNKITKANGKGREVIYSLAPETQKALQSKKEVCLNSYQHLASFFEKS